MTPLFVLRSLPLLTREPALRDFLRLDATSNHFHDVDYFHSACEDAFFEWLVADVRRAADLVEAREYDRLLSDYFRNLKAFQTEGKITDPKTGKTRDPDLELMNRMENLIGVGGEQTAFRTGLMTRMAVFKLDHPDRDINYEKLFGELYARLEHNLFSEQRAEVRRLVEDALVVEDVRAGRIDRERRDKATTFITRLREELGYPRHAMVEALTFFLTRTES